MVKTKGRVVLSKNPKSVLETAQTIFKKHDSLGAASPLNLIEDFSWTVTGPKIALALDAHNSAEFHKGEMEKQYAARDLLMPEVTDGVKSSINLLKSTFAKNPKKLADWGVSVDDSPKEKGLTV